MRCSKCGYQIRNQYCALAPKTHDVAIYAHVIPRYAFPTEGYHASSTLPPTEPVFLPKECACSHDMFRNPRQSQARDADSALKPSVGRAPSPHPGQHHTQLPSPPLAAMATKTVTATSTPRKAPVLRGNVAKPKSATPKNGNIMNFFKKAEQLPNSDPLFVGGFAGFGQAQAEEAIRMEDGEGDEYEELDLGGRFNENGGSNKRRRTSSHIEEAIDAAAQVRPDAAGAGAKACSPPPPDFDVDGEASGNATVAQRVGPFVEESDSEDEMRDTTQTPEIDGHLEQRNESLPDEPHNDLEDVDHLAGHGENDVPSLKREQTSYPDEDGFADFEGMEDFDDEYEGGDEFLEKRWQMQQRRLELEEGGFEGEFDDEDDYDNIKQEDTDFGEFTSAAACPICEASLAGVSDQEASVHVNNCLDGNPTPLSIPQPETKSEPDDSSASKPAPSTKFKRPARPARPGQENPFRFGQPEGNSSAFSKLMSGHAEDTAWAIAAADEHASRGKPSYRRTCPFYKILPGFNICVDAFRYGAVQGCNAYFLSHFHSDHYIGLTATWSHGPIYCSRPTANLVRQQLRVDPKWVVDLEFETKVEVPGTNGVFVTMIPANHCPGSSLYLFEKITGRGKSPKVHRVLHCGDFRACPAHVEHPLLKPDVVDSITGKTAQQKIDVCYLDTTYLNPRYAFPSQEDVIQACADMCISLNKTKVDSNDSWELTKAARAGGTMTKFVSKEPKEDVNGDAGTPAANEVESKSRGRLLVVVGTYSIGKERICLGIARALDSKIYAPAGKQRICAALEDTELNARLTRDPREAQVHMTPLFDIRAETLGDYLAEYHDRFSRAVGFRPSGWNYRPPGSRFTESPAVGTVLYSDNWKSGYSMRELVPQRGSNSRSATYGVPYSEHSSFRELSMFCCALRIDKIIPTVNVGSAKSREKMKLWIERWTTWKKKEGLFKVDRGEDGKNEWYPSKGTWELRTTL